MSPEILTLVGFFALFALLLLRVPVGVSMIIVGVGGFAAVVGPGPAMKILAQSPIRSATSEVFGIVPMFILMGAFTTASGMSRELFEVSNAWLGHRRGGLAMAAMTACAGFAAICGSSVACAATMGRVALPEMRRLGYQPAFSCATVAAGGTLGILIPPSIVLALYGILVEEDIAKLFAAAVIPGLLAFVLYLVTVQLIAWRNPSIAPAGDRVSMSRALHSLKDLWATLALFALVIGGIYVGIFTPTEAAAMGAGGALIIGLARRRLSARQIVECLTEAARTTGAIFIIVIGAIIFGYFLAVTQVPQKLTAFVAGLDLGPHGILTIVLIVYLILGAFLDAMAIIVLTVPIIHPLILHLGFDPIWFGVILVMVIELGLITPPYGMNVFVIKSVSRDVSLGHIFVGIMPFIATDIVRLAILVIFPQIALFLPGTMR